MTIYVRIYILKSEVRMVDSHSCRMQKEKMQVIEFLKDDVSGNSPVNQCCFGIAYITITSYTCCSLLVLKFK